jgi:hypothetical protein
VFALSIGALAAMLSTIALVAVASIKGQKQDVGTKQEETQARARDKLEDRKDQLADMQAQAKRKSGATP